MAAHTSGFEYAMRRLKFEHERELALLRAEISDVKHWQVATNSKDPKEEVPVCPESNTRPPFWADPLAMDKAAEKPRGSTAQMESTFQANGTALHCESVNIGSEVPFAGVEQCTMSQSSGGSGNRNEISEKQRKSKTLLRLSSNSSIGAHCRWDDHIVLHPMWLTESARVGERRLQSVLMSKYYSEEALGGSFDLMKKLFHSRNSTSNESATSVAIIVTCAAALIMRPGSRRKLAWDACAMSALSFDLFWLPFQVFRPEETIVIALIVWGTLFIWTLDIIVAPFTGYCKSDGTEVIEFRLIVKRYLKTWFIPDILIVGLDWFLMLENINDGGGSSRGGSAARIVKVMRLLRMLRTLRFLRLLKLREFFYAAQQKLDTEWASIVYGMIFNVVIILVLNHTFACFWFLLGKSRNDGWVEASNALEKGLQWQYFASLHWTLTQFTPASMEIVPVTDDERVFAVFLLLLGLLVFSSFLSSVTAGVTRLRNMQEARARERYSLRRYLRENRVSSGLGVRINRYIDIVQQVRHQNVPASEVKLLNLLSGPLRIELQTELHSPALIAHEVFWLYDKKSHSAMSELCFEAVSVSHLSKHDCLFSVFKQAHFMYVSTSGAMVYIRLEDAESAAPLRCYIQQGLIISEPTLWVPWIHREVFGRITQQQPDVKVAMMAYAKKYIETMKRAAEDHGLLFDLDHEEMLLAAIRFTDMSGEVAEVVRAERFECEILHD